MDGEWMQDPADRHPGLVWREKVVVGDVVQTMRGPMPTTTVERKLDLDMERLALFGTVPAPEGMLPQDSAIREAGRATLRERKAKNTYREALRRLVSAALIRRRSEVRVLPGQPCTTRPGTVTETAAREHGQQCGVRLPDRPPENRRRR